MSQSPNEILEMHLARIAQDPVACRNVERGAISILTHLGMSWKEAAEFVKFATQNAAQEWLASTETVLADHLPNIVNENLPSCMERRAASTVAQFIDHLQPGTVLDLGGGGGEIAEALQRYKYKKFEMTIADIHDYRGSASKNMPFVTIHDNVIDLADCSMDSVIILMALHHSTDREKLLREAFRVAKTDVIVIESVTNTLDEFLYGCWIDWFYNRVIHYTEDVKKRIPVPCNFLPASGWEQLAWTIIRKRPIVSRDLGVCQHLNPERHWLFHWKK